MTATHDEILKKAELYEHGGMDIEQLQAWCEEQGVTPQQWKDFCASRGAYHKRGAQIWLVVLILVFIALFLVFLL